jgi:hypothetical protein
MEELKEGEVIMLYYNRHKIQKTVTNLAVLAKNKKI